MLIARPKGAVLYLAAVFFAAILAPHTAFAQSASWFSVPDFSGGSHFRLSLSPYTWHQNYNEEHKPVYAIASERQYDNGWLYGGSYFRNSFGQPSGFAYLGKRYSNVWQTQPLFLQWTAGLLYGYRGKFEDKVPLNHNGFSPGILLSAGWQLDERMSVQFNALGDAGLMFQMSYRWR